MIDIDLVLSGSGARLPAHAGALYAIVESEKFNIRRIAGVSGGSIIAAAYAASCQTGLPAVKFVKSLSIDTDFESLVVENKFFRLIRFATKTGLYTGDKIEKFIDEKLGKLMLNQLPNLHIVTTDIINKVGVVMTAKTYPTLLLSKAIRRSISIPFIFVPNYRTNGVRRCFVDGGVTNNYPIDMFDDNSQPTIGVRLQGQAKIIPADYELSTAEFSGAVIETMMAEIERKHVEDAHWANTITVETADVSSTDFNISRVRKEWLFDQGYNAAKKFIAEKYS